MRSAPRNGRVKLIFRLVPAALIGWIFLQHALLSSVLSQPGAMTAAPGGADAFRSSSTSLASSLITNNENNKNNTAVAIMPEISFPDAETIEVSVANQNWTIVASTSGGCESKFEVILPSSEEFIFKPSHGLARASKGGYEFRPSKGGIVWIQKEHPAKILNELIAFTVDQILGLERTPPVLPFEVPRQRIQDALAGSKSKTYFDCTMDFSVADAWIQNDNSQQPPAVVGTLQYKLSRVEKLSQTPYEFITSLMHAPLLTWSRYYYRFFSSRRSSFMDRERNTRTLFDFLIGNWDRSNNEFIHHLKQERHHSRRLTLEESSLLVYIDQNALRTQMVPFDNFLENDLTHSQCRFYWDPVQKLRKPTSFQKAVLEQMRKHDLVSRWMSPSSNNSSEVIIHPDQLGPLRYMDNRRQALLDRVDRCVDRFGFAHVYRL